MGRVTTITYPSGDEQAWYPKNITYAVVSGSERGLNGSHWRRTVTKGNYVQLTYFDAMLRPLLTDTSISGTPNSDITVETDYDWKGRKTFARTPLPVAQALGLRRHTTTYDPLDRVTEVDRTSELGTLKTKTTYLPGAQHQVTDPNGNVTTTSYQVFDDPSAGKVSLVQAPSA